ncbi:MAG: response regulator [Acidobacteria bacterium]|nr:response regulator [Acidobacteriota bacterium]
MDLKQAPELDSRMLRIAVDQSPLSIVITDSLGCIEFVNPRFCELTGYGKEELLGRTPGVLKSGRTSEKDYRRLWSTLNSGLPWSGVFCNRKKNGDLYWEAARICPVVDSDRRITHFLGIKEDISELKRLEEELAHAGKLDWLGRLASGIAHDFNNLLTSILGFGGPVQKALSGTRMGDDLGRVLSAAERATELARDLYVPGSRTPAKPRRLDLNIALQSMSPLLRRLLSPHIRFEFQPGNLEEEIFVDPVELQQIVINLLACRPDSSSLCRTIQIVTARVDVGLEQAGSFPWVHPGPFLAIEIRDPVCPAAPPRPDEPAAAAIRILRDNGGFLSLGERDGEGDCARIYLPVARTRAAADLAALARNTANPGAAASILLVEDDEMVAKWLGQVLRSGGYSVLRAGSAEEVFQILGAGSAMPTILITDFRLPGMNGVTMVERLRAVSPGFKVVYITGSSVPDNLPAGTTMLQKPFTPEEILGSVAALAQQSIGAVLVIDDDDGIRELIRVTLERAGYTVVDLADGTGVEAELARRPFDLVITDLVMPQREGLEIIQAVRRLYPELPVVATSGAFGGYFLDVARKLGAEQILLKPLRPDELVGCVRRLLQSRPESQPCH